MGGLLTGCAPSFFIHLGGGGERGSGRGGGGIEVDLKCLFPLIHLPTFARNLIFVIGKM